MNDEEFEYCPICFSTDGKDYDTSTNEVICLNCGERWIADTPPSEEELDEF